jgi:xanthine dehydrogenase accessory factor
LKDLETIVAAAEHARASGQSAAIATVVAVEGSAYRLPGARMLIVEGQWIAGSISGGCLEDDVVMRAREAVEKGVAIVTKYDTTSDDDIVFGVGLGCKGIITILVEPVRSQAYGPDFLSFARSCLTERAAGIVATVVRVHGRARVKPGARLLSIREEACSDVTDFELESNIAAAIPRMGQAPELVTFTLDRGAVDVFFERIQPAAPLIVFGAGHDAMPVVRLAKALGWHVTLIDHRPAYATASRFPLADRIVVSTPAAMSAHIDLTDETLALVMTHNYLRDLDLLAFLLRSPISYLGLLGPRRRTDQLLADLQRRGVQPTTDQLARLYAPVGLDIGAEGPAEVALSIVSEIQTVMTAHPATHLRERKNPIHRELAKPQARASDSPVDPLPSCARSISPNHALSIEAARFVK